MDSRVELNGVAGSGAWLPHRLGGFVVTEGLPLLGRPALRAQPDYLPSLPLACADATRSTGLAQNRAPSAQGCSIAVQVPLPVPLTVGALPVHKPSIM